MNIQQQYEKACDEYQVVISDALVAEAKYEGAKKRYEVELATIAQMAEGKTNAEKERNASASEENLILVKRLSNLRTFAFQCKAKRLGYEATLDRLRTNMSYNKELLNKGIIDE